MGKNDLVDINQKNLLDLLDLLDRKFLIGGPIFSNSLIILLAGTNRRQGIAFG
jgi:hypothetical protein